MDNTGRIHMGGLDEAERNRLLNRARNNDDTMSIASDTTIVNFISNDDLSKFFQATTTFEKPKSQAPRGDQVFSHSQVYPFFYSPKIYLLRNHWKQRKNKKN